MQRKDPEHHSSHGSLHREHMQVPVALSVPFKNTKLYTYNLVPTILALIGRQVPKQLDGVQLELEDGACPVAGNLYSER